MVDRTLAVRLRRAAVGALLAVALVLPATASVVLTFEDLDPSPASFDVMPSPYNGFAFSGWFYGPETVYTPASGTIDLFTDYIDPNDPGAFVVTDTNNAITSASAFYFDGAAFSGYSGVTFELFLAGTLVHTSATLPEAPGVDPYLPSFLASGYSGLIDTIVVSGVQGYYAMDDFKYHTESTTAIPEPATGALTAIALLAVGAISTRRRARPR